MNKLRLLGAVLSGALAVAPAMAEDFHALSQLRNVSMVLRHFFRKITVEAFPPSPVDPVCALPGRQAY
jgi:hypothetical protein